MDMDEPTTVAAIDFDPIECYVDARTSHCPQNAYATGGVLSAYKMDNLWYLGG